MFTISIPSKRKLLFLFLVPANLVFFILIVVHLEKNQVIKTSVTQQLSTWSNFDFSYLSSYNTNSTLISKGYQLEPQNVKFKFTNPLKKSGTAKDIQKANIKFYDEFMSHKISEPKDYDLSSIRAPGKDEKYNHANATIVSLVRNNEYQSLIKSLILFEKKFNYKFKYPYTFINDEEFTENFKKHVLSYTSGPVEFVTIPPHLWAKPSHIDSEKEKKAQDEMYKQNVAYAKRPSYHNMCRFYSGTFFDVPELQKYRWYLRLEPSIKYYSDINYDVFKYLEGTGKVYGFVLNLYDIPESIRTLWSTTLKWLNLSENFKYVNENGAFNWILESMSQPRNFEVTEFSTCHFWSNFEIGDMEFFRGEAYRNWFDYLDEQGGFYYERWGDAPVHSLALGLFADRKKIHWFRDIGYFHDPYLQCPNSDNTRVCKTGQFSRWGHLQDQNCMTNWIQLAMDEEDINIYN